MVTPDGPNRDLRVEGFEDEPPVVGPSLRDAFIALWLCIITPVRAWYSREEAGDSHRVPKGEQATERAFQGQFGGRIFVWFVSTSTVYSGHGEAENTS